MHRSILLTFLVLLFATGAGAKGKRRKGKLPDVVERADGDLTHLHLAEDPKKQGWLYKPPPREDDEEGQLAADRRFDLIVALHGAGGNPKNYFHRRMMEERQAWCLTVAGRQAVTTQNGEGFQWSGADRAYIADLVRYVVGKYPIDPERVIVWGHSAGGTMTLQALAEAPELFAGGLTTASPGTPSSTHAGKRVCVFMGTADPNWSAAPTVRAHLERVQKKKGKGGACAFFAVDGLGHNVPEENYLALGFDWILQPKARGGEARVPQTAKGRSGTLHHILVRHKGAEGADGIKRSKSKAQKLLKKIRKEVAKSRAWFPFEAAAHSEDGASGSCGGGVEPDTLQRAGVQVPELKPGEVAGPLPGKEGFHLVYRPPAPTGAQ